jgi:phage terminase large subunit-like protein
MVLMTSNGYVGVGSPNRVDAMVWALTELMLTHVPIPAQTTIALQFPVC